MMALPNGPGVFHYNIASTDLGGWPLQYVSSNFIFLFELDFEPCGIHWLYLLPAGVLRLVFPPKISKTDAVFVFQMVR